MAEMSAKEAAQICYEIADGYEFDQQGESDYHDKWIKAIRYACRLPLP